MGYAVERDGKIVSAKSFLMMLELPPIADEVEKFESEATDALLRMRDQWKETGRFQLDFMSDGAFIEEAARAVNKDLPLIPLVFFIMTGFCCLVFSNRNSNQSRILLGFAAVASVTLSLMTGFGTPAALKMGIIIIRDFCAWTVCSNLILLPQVYSLLVECL